MRSLIASSWLRWCGLFAGVQILGYLIAIELRDRFSQERCSFVVFCIIIVCSELHAVRKRRRAIIGRK